MIEINKSNAKTLHRNTYVVQFLAELNSATVHLTSVALKTVSIHEGDVPLSRKRIHVNKTRERAGDADLTKKKERTTLQEYAQDTQNIPMNVTSPLPIVGRHTPDPPHIEGCRSRQENK